MAIVIKATSGVRVSGVMDNYAPQRNEMRRAEWEWRYAAQREPVPVETAKDMRAVVAAILARRCC